MKREETLKVVALNRKARHNYSIEETIEAGIALKGTEIKSVREGRVSLQEAYARPDKGELWLLGGHIAPYTGGNRSNHEPGRPRRLLLHRKQIDTITGKVHEKGFTLVPLKMYLKGHLAKVELGLARGRKLYDKRQVIIQRETERQVERTIKSRRSERN